MYESPSLESSLGIPVMFDYPEYRSQMVACIHCGWRGFGSELVFNETHPLTKFRALDCPKCRRHIDFVRYYNSGVMVDTATPRLVLLHIKDHFGNEADIDGSLNVAGQQPLSGYLRMKLRDIRAHEKNLPLVAVYQELVKEASLVVSYDEA
jgi:hypothetical protein